MNGYVVQPEGSMAKLIEDIPSPCCPPASTSTQHAPLGGRWRWWQRCATRVFCPQFVARAPFQPNS
jgi:hypothetical protein